MEWTKIEVSATPFGAEIVTGVLLDCGVVGAEIINAQERVRHLAETAHLWDYADDNLLEVLSDDVYVVFYVTKDADGGKILEDVTRRLSRIKNEFAGLGALEIKSQATNDEAWLNEWKKHFKPLSVGKIVIVPEWETYENTDGEIIFTIDPGSAFGTGQHQTTRLCIFELQEFLQNGDRLLDIGCGSGILSIIGLLLGADAVLACDIDPAGAIAATKKNAELNPVDLNRLQIFSGDALSCDTLRSKICANKYEVIVANIVADVIVELLPFVRGLLSPGGVFIASGIIDEREAEVLAAFRKNKFDILKNSREEGWCCIVGK
jgi:ribosomal protein L11 methyltransferase